MLYHSSIFRHIGITALAVVVSTASALAAGPREVPAVTGPIPGTSAANHPFDAAAYQVVPIDLAARGYREDEYFLSGKARAC